MEKYKALTKDVPWDSFGRSTVAASVGLSLLPVGVLPFEAKPLPTDPSAGLPGVSMLDPEFEKYLMNIVGTAIQAGDGKLITCAHVVQALLDNKAKGYILAKIVRPGAVRFVPYPIQVSIGYVDPRTERGNPDVDAAALLVAAKSTATLPYEVPSVRWGNSAATGVGDSVFVGGYPYGTEMALFTKSNRGIIQPTFYSGIVSAVLPATKPTETRILQISVASAGGMSGGAVFLPDSGEIIGMITSCVHSNGIPQPMSYALPSEILAPFVEVISFTRG